MHMVFISVIEDSCFLVLRLRMLLTPLGVISRIIKIGVIGSAILQRRKAGLLFKHVHEMHIAVISHHVRYGSDAVIGGGQKMLCPVDPAGSHILLDASAK